MGRCWMGWRRSPVVVSIVLSVGAIAFVVAVYKYWDVPDGVRDSLGARLEITQVVVKNAEKPRAVSVPEESYSTDPSKVVDNPEIDIVCELKSNESEKSYCVP